MSTELRVRASDLKMNGGRNDQDRRRIYRMVMPDHVCPWGLKARHLLRVEGYKVDDHWLTTREETDAFKAEHGVKTTPQTFIDGKRIGGYDDLRRYLGLKVARPEGDDLHAGRWWCSLTTAVMARDAEPDGLRHAPDRPRAASGSSPCR